MEQKEKQGLAQSLLASTPTLAKPHISEQEMERYPCSVRPVEVEVPDGVAVKVYLTVPFQVQSGAPVMVNYHGGGFIRGRDDRYELFCRRLACTFQCVVMDVDNDHSENPADWILPEALAEEYADIRFAICFSRS